MLAGARPAASVESVLMLPEMFGEGGGLWNVFQAQKARPISSSAQRVATIGREADARFDMTRPLAEKSTPEGCQLTGFCGEGNEPNRKQIALWIGPIMPLCLTWGYCRT